MSSSNTKTPESKTREDPTSKQAMDSSLGTKTHEESKKPPEENKDPQQNQGPDGGEEQEEEEEEEGECGFCLFMKGGGCKGEFIAWENCIQEGENNKEDIVEKCFEVTSALRKCMEAHADYYEPILRAEKKAEEEAMKELEKEKAAAKESESEIIVIAEEPENAGSSGK